MLKKHLVIDLVHLKFNPINMDEQTDQNIDNINMEYIILVLRGIS